MRDPDLQAIAEYIDASSSERVRRWRAKYAQCCADFSAGTITVHVFRAHLYSLGYRGREIETEVNLHWPKKD